MILLDGVGGGCDVVLSSDLLECSFMKVGESMCAGI